MSIEFLLNQFLTLFSPAYLYADTNDAVEEDGEKPPNDATADGDDGADEGLGDVDGLYGPPGEDEDGFIDTVGKAEYEE